MKTPSAGGHGHPTHRRDQLLDWGECNPALPQEKANTMIDWRDRLFFILASALAFLLLYEALRGG